MGTAHWLTVALLALSWINGVRAQGPGQGRRFQPSPYSCDCRPSWQCPQSRWTQPLHSCRFRGSSGYCCPTSQTRGNQAAFSPSGSSQFGPSNNGRSHPNNGFRPSSFRPSTNGRVRPSTNSGVRPNNIDRFRPSGGGFTAGNTIISNGKVIDGGTIISDGQVIDGGTIINGGNSASGSISSDCIPLILCPILLSNPGRLRGQTCRLSDGSHGVLCSSFVNPMEGAGGDFTNERPLLFSRTMRDAFMAFSDSGDINAAARQAQQSIARQKEINRRLLTTRQLPPKNSPTSIFNLNFLSSQALQDTGLQALESIQVATEVRSQGSSRGQDFITFISHFGDEEDANNEASPSRVPGCQEEGPIFCSTSKFRTINGECNNLQRPRLGRGKTGFKRLMMNTYEDGIFATRSRSVQGGDLPSPRRISERVIDTISKELSGYTLSVMQWGQFIDHDLNHALVFRLGEQAIECCQDDGGTFPDTLVHPQCIPIRIPDDDPFYSQFGQKCMTLTRSIPAPDPDCIARPATPINELTAYLDASMLYGSEKSRLDTLRTFQRGQMIVTENQKLPYRSTKAVGGPQNGEEVEMGQMCRDNSQVCYRAGEARVNEQSGLTVMHTLFMREHNRIADELQRNHRNWRDERVFQETRRIVIAEWQHIVYNEWLPIVVGLDYARDHFLLPLQSGFSDLYDSTLDASASNEFATAAFRFGHSLLRDMYDLINSSGFVVGTVNLTRTFFDPSILADQFTEHARTLVATRGENFDLNVIRSVHEQLFTTNFRFGLDLIALNIQRGRDHGIPTYASALEACTGAAARSWGDLNRLMASRSIDQLRSVYADVKDVDLFIGGLSERRASGALVGPTFQCLIGQQFFDIRFGDRFFYDYGGQPHSFTEAQLREIRKSSWARIMCDTLSPEFGGDFANVQPLAFIEAGVGPNKIAPCNTLAVPSMDLSVF